MSAQLSTSCEIETRATSRPHADSIRAAILPARHRQFAASNLLSGLEWTVATLASLTVLVLVLIRGAHAGALWRDESAAVQLAQMPTFSDIAHNFQHEAFPLLFPAILRGYISAFGASDFAMRTFGVAVGFGLIVALWIAARITHRGLPLISIPLLGLNTTFLISGASIRGYGVGCLLIILVFASFVGLVVNSSPTRIVVTALAALGAVQTLVYNLVLLIAIVLAVCALALLRRQATLMIAALGILALCMVSFIPYVGPYSSGSEWSVVVEFPVTSRLLWTQLNAALGNPHPLLAIVWYVPLAALFGYAVWQFVRRGSRSCAPPDVVLFAALVTMASLVGYYAFLHLLSYLPRSWYYLALIGILAVSLDSLGGALLTGNSLRIARLTFSLLVLGLLPTNVWSTIVQRQTNIDFIATKLAQAAHPADLIVVAPWQYGISLGRYYRGTTPWTTLPSITDLRVHRYDLFREKMLSTNAIKDVLDKVGETLASGHRVWIVGGIRLPAAGEQPRVLPTAPNASVGWDNVAYSESWLEQFSVFVRNHSARGRIIALSNTGPVSQFEDVPLVVAEGAQ